MMIFGTLMETNIEYEKGKQILKEYIEKENNLYSWLKDMFNRYENCPYDYSPEFAGFDYNSAIKFIRTWEIINNDLPIDKKNLILIYNACGGDNAKTLEIFNGTGKVYKNKATLCVLICNTKKIIKQIYNEKYGDC